MIFISLSPLRLTRILFLLGIGLTSATAPAQSLFFAVGSTPYDRQMVRVDSVLLSSEQSRVANPRLSLLTVNHWMGTLRSIPYRYSWKWRTPAEVRLAKAGDCKGKAVALYQIMHRHGARNVRLVIGKHRIEDRNTHAWIEWTTQNGLYLLDPTFNRAVTRAEEYGGSAYVPFYAYEGTRKYRAVYAPAYHQFQLAAVSKGAP